MERNLAGVKTFINWTPRNPQVSNDLVKNGVQKYSKVILFGQISDGFRSNVGYHLNIGHSTVVNMCIFFTACSAVLCYLDDVMRAF